MMHQTVRVLLACGAVIGLLAGDLTVRAAGAAQGVSPALQQRAGRLQKERDNVELQTSVPPPQHAPNGAETTSPTISKARIPGTPSASTDEAGAGTPLTHSLAGSFPPVSTASVLAQK